MTINKFSVISRSQSQRKRFFRQLAYQLIMFTVDMAKDNSRKHEHIFLVSLHQWRSLGGVREAVPFAQLMMIDESPNILSLGNPIIWDVCRRAQSPINYALVLVLRPTPNANSKECDSFKCKQKPTPPALLADAP